jgi:hypothetical protein
MRGQLTALDPHLREQVKLHLEQVLASPHLRNSRRCQTLLRYVVENALDGNADALKERVIGQAVFDREAGYDTNQDAVVRNAAAEVRKRLAQYYLEAGPAGYEIRIELPSGTYAPEFHAHSLGVPAEAPARIPAVRRIGWLNVALALLALVALSGWLVTARRDVRPPATELDRFWAPLLATPAPVQICVGQSRMYYSPRRLPEGQPNLTIPINKLEPMRDRFLWYGDAVSMAEVSGFLSMRHKQYRFRGALVTPYAELLGNPIVLIGAFNNEWTTRLTEGLRFSLVNGDTPDVRGVRDREKGSALVWHVTRSPQGWIADEDYALVTRIFDPQTRQIVVACGGISHFGTMAAGAFLSNSVYFREAVRSAPPDWNRKNIQVVLQTKVVEGTPGPPNILAAYFW